MPSLASLSPTDIGKPVLYDLGSEKKQGTIAGFNESCVHVRIDDGTTLPMPWHILERMEGKEEGPSAAVASALTSLAAAGFEARAINAQWIEIEGVVRWAPSVGMWKEFNGEMKPGGLASVIAATRAEKNAMMERATQPSCSFSRCPHPDQCQDGCASPARRGS